jgi:hypothetical protein
MSFIIMSGIDRHWESNYIEGTTRQTERMAKDEAETKNTFFEAKTPMLHSLIICTILKGSWFN